ncbi:MAG: BON domain-containing protein [Bryobacteraceae bacterium]
MKNIVLKSVLVLGASGLMLAAQAPQSQESAESQSQTTRGTHVSATDSQMTMQVRHAITEDTALGPDAHNVRVSTKNGTVTLRGKVSSEQDKDMIVSKAKQIAGDSNVKDDLTVAKK